LEQLYEDLLQQHQGLKARLETVEKQNVTLIQRDRERERAEQENESEKKREGTKETGGGQQQQNYDARVTSEQDLRRLVKSGRTPLERLGIANSLSPLPLPPPAVSEAGLAAKDKQLTTVLENICKMESRVEELEIAKELLEKEIYRRLGVSDDEATAVIVTVALQAAEETSFGSFESGIQNLCQKCSVVDREWRREKKEQEILREQMLEQIDLIEVFVCVCAYHIVLNHMCDCSNVETYSVRICVHVNTQIYAPPHKYTHLAGASGRSYIVISQLKKAGPIFRVISLDRDMHVYNTLYQRCIFCIRANMLIRMCSHMHTHQVHNTGL